VAHRRTAAGEPGRANGKKPKALHVQGPCGPVTKARQIVSSPANSKQLVVVGVDGSPESVAALKWAAKYAAATGALTRAVISWHFPAAAGPAPVGVAPKPISDEAKSHMQDTLDKVMTEVYGTATPDNVQPLVAYGHPSQALMSEAEDADLLVVGHRGHGSFTGMLIGSVSMHAVSHSPCPVVVVRGHS